jgi:DNA-binding HxlR family transcriptional regulator
MHDKNSCTQARLAIRDTLEVVGGKWKLILISTLTNGPMKFNELSRACDITPRVLSKELHELEMNGLVARTVCDTKPVSVSYSLTEYSNTLNKLLGEMQKWGQAHRAKIIRETIATN